MSEKLLRIAAGLFVAIALTLGIGSLAIGLTFLFFPTGGYMWLFLLVPLFFAVRRLQRRRQIHDWEREGLCPNCGYDLRATPDRCPEFGD
ncbi:MAG TPA: hypothetical protein VH370_11015 [Humisphaera sp.]|jgi:hypothetical protein|nr:hypothetical protein [Humisphaera sp.]